MTPSIDRFFRTIFIYKWRAKKRELPRQKKKKSALNVLSVIKTWGGSRLCGVDGGIKDSFQPGAFLICDGKKIGETSCSHFLVRWKLSLLAEHSQPEALQEGAFVCSHLPGNPGQG